ncbi:carbohydrate ABC transporter substrate-binding protein [Paenibacillus mesophilus]|uniref:ABC transporter substrate-binding protein n=1 Tax=Paenibacillus mesophilus TaxID=2582849 RepID=UPI00110D574E|nr:ABC transporter substrate-binding protein [Paenibacillus mesophilus]TMV45249.1 carbohydrate ABC transporter substrate-binding protein [Paenibacillus mesophilus]
MLKKAALSLALLVPVVAACGGNDRKGAGAENPGQQPKPAAKEPIELTLSLYSATPEEFEKFYVAPLKEKFPHITLKGIRPEKGAFIEDLLASGTVPDIFVGSKGALPNQLNGLSLTEDIGALIKNNNYDLSKLDPVAVDIMQKATNGKIVGLPLNLNVNALYYNKNLFDKFGVPYPKDGMTWDETYELAKKLTRMEQNVQYRGFSDRWGDTFFAANPFELPYLDPKEEKSTFQNEGWKKIADNWLRFYTLPGLKFDLKTAFKEEDRKVFQTGISGMTIMALDVPKWEFAWDIVSVPTYKEKPGIGLQANARYNFIMKGSKKQQAAFEVAAYMTSEEYQLKMAKDGLFPVLTDEKVKKVYMENDPVYKGKNIKAFYYNKFASEPQGRAPGLVNGVNAQDKYLLPEMMKVLAENKDLNSALRDAHEGAMKGLAEAKSK